MRSLLLVTSTSRQGINREDDGKSRLGWRLSPTRTHDVHQVDGIDMITAKMDLLMKKLEASSNMETAKIIDAHMMCEVCGNVGHSGNDCLEIGEEASFINNGNNNGFRNNNFNNQGGTQGPTSRSTIKMEVTILTFSIISLQLKILSLAKLELMKV
jgi:hypothetical protein